MQIDKQMSWDEMAHRASKVTDKLGKHIDEGILETVIILRLLGFNTTASCEGHLQRITGGPYIIFESEIARSYAQEARGLRKKPDEVNTVYNQLRRKAIYYSMLEVQKLITYLEAFYNGRSIPLIHQLTIRSFPMTANRLGSQGAELAYVSDKVA